MLTPKPNFYSSIQTNKLQNESKDEKKQRIKHCMSPLKNVHAFNCSDASEAGVDL